MRHSLSLRCVRYALRPVTMEDAAFIVELRNDPFRNRFLHEVSPRVEDQIAWLEKYYARPGDYYFMIEALGSKERQGTVGIYDATENGKAEWGRWILKRGSMAALESAWLIHEVAFSLLRLASLCSCTIAENESVVSFHRNFGATFVAEREGHFLVAGERRSAIECCITTSEWPVLRARHYSMISRWARHGG